MNLERLAEVYITVGDVLAGEDARIEEQPIEDDISKCITLVQDCMGIDFQCTARFDRRAKQASCLEHGKRVGNKHDGTPLSLPVSTRFHIQEV